MNFDVKPADLECKIKGTCLTCEEQKEFIQPEEITDKRLRPITAGCVQSCIDTGIGHSGIEKFLKGMNMAGTMPPKRYHLYSGELQKTIVQNYEEHLGLIAFVHT